MASEQAKEVTSMINALFEKIGEDAYQRHLAGSETYGPLKFLENDTLEMAYEELLDLINYASYTAAKVLLLQRFIAQQAAAVDSPDTTGAGAFIPMSEAMKGFRKE